jgi:hypothetical protein
MRGGKGAMMVNAAPGRCCDEKTDQPPLLKRVMQSNANRAGARRRQNFDNLRLDTGQPLDQIRQSIE